MKIKTISLVCGAVLLSAGCVNHSSDNNMTMQSASYSGNAMQAQTDAKVLGAMIVLNQNEIASAQMAEKKSSNPAVVNYAKLMVNQHNNNLREMENMSRKLGVMPEQGNAAMDLQRKGKQEMTMLSKLNSGAFDKAYMAAMVKDHTAALALIDHRLTQQAYNPQLRSALVATRGHVANHLAQAKMIQKEMSR